MGHHYLQLSLLGEHPLWKADLSRLPNNLTFSPLCAMKFYFPLASLYLINAGRSSHHFNAQLRSVLGAEKVGKQRRTVS